MSSLPIDPGDSHDWRAAGWWRDATFYDDLVAGAHAHPHKRAVTTLDAATGETVSKTWAEVLADAQQCAAALHELGVRRGDAVSIMLGNRWELAPLMLGCLRIGAVINPLLPMYRRRELTTILGLVQPVVMITVATDGDAAIADLALDLAADLPSLRTVAVSGADRPAGTLDFETFFFGTHREPLDGPSADPDELCLVLFTSGTTGEPKGVRHTPNTLHAAIRGEADAYGLDDSLVMTASAIFMHYTGIVQGMFLPVLTGGTMVFTDSKRGSDMLRLIAEQGTTLLYGTPAVVRDLLDAQAAHPTPTPALRHLVTGSSPVPPHYIPEVRERFGLQLHALWGMSENGPVTMTRDTDPPDWAAHSDGSPVAAMQLRIVPADPPAEDGSGQLRVKGPTQCLGYQGRDEAYAATLDADGFFVTGDLARPDGRGGIRVTGRESDIIFRFGIGMQSTEFESMIAAHPKVREAALIGIPDGRGDEVLHAVVAPVDADVPLTDDDVRQVMSDHAVMELYWPSHVHNVDALPRTATGKVVKVELEQRYS